MANCTNCGTQPKDGVKFCPGCGAALQAQTVPREASPQQPRTQNGQPPKQKGSAKGKLSDLNNTADTTASFRPDDIEKNKMMGVLAYILFLPPSWQRRSLLLPGSTQIRDCLCS